MRPSQGSEGPAPPPPASTPRRHKGSGARRGTATVRRSARSAVAGVRYGRRCRRRPPPSPLPAAYVAHAGEALVPLVGRGRPRQRPQRHRVDDHVLASSFSRPRPACRTTSARSPSPSTPTEKRVKSPGSCNSTLDSERSITMRIAATLASAADPRRTSGRSRSSSSLDRPRQRGERRAPRLRSLLAAWARASSAERGARRSRRRRHDLVGGTSSSKYPLLSASAGPNWCDRITALSTGCRA